LIVHIHVESPVSTISSVCSSEHFLIQPSSYSLHGSSQEVNHNQEINYLRQMAPVNYSHHLPYPLWRPNFRPFISGKSDPSNHK